MTSPAHPERVWTRAEIIERLKILERKLDDEGMYVGRNTVSLAIMELEEGDLSTNDDCECGEDVCVCLDPTNDV